MHLVHKVLENKTTKIVDFDRPGKLRPSKVCSFMVFDLAYVLVTAQIECIYFNVTQF